MARKFGMGFFGGFVGSPKEWGGGGGGGGGGGEGRGGEYVRGVT